MNFQRKEYPFPWRNNNRIALLIDAAKFYPAILEAISKAKNEILIEMYLVESGHVLNRFFSALELAVEKGICVRLILDDFGSRGLSARDKSRLETSNIEIHYYNPFHYGRLRRSLFRDHRKIFIVDGTIAFVGGAGLTDAFENQANPALSWRDTMVSVSGPCVADWKTLFYDNWPQADKLESTTEKTQPVDDSEQYAGRVSVTPRHGKLELKRSLIKRIRGAERQIWIATAYFLPSQKIRRALARAARSGVDVRLLLPGKHTDHPAVRHAGRRFYHYLLKNKIRIFEYQPRFTHSKVMLADNWVSIGSSNIDRWNLRWNLEANQEVDSSDFAQKIITMFENDLEHSTEITLSMWKRRSRYRRLLEWFWGKIDVFIDALSRRKS
ncbi:MAG: phosphatidylserine/phosphatidylglycerophosphate/cardiolipin synthase family protein [Gammaproteobacteria bacterium]|nr:phosphatidylserine/phosphatidylglycerophosphate/cardiolipin synthase family protein [Gammaproteobacteria bacterium]